MDPRTGATLDPPFPEASAEDVSRAAEAAAAAFREYGWWPDERRAQLLRAVADEIELAGAELTARAAAETALPPARLDGERARTVGQLLLMADAVAEGSWVEARIDRADPARAPQPRPDLRRMLVPLGPVAVFGASNFPLAFGVPGGDTASALAAGCPVVCKAHPAHPGTAAIAAAAIERALRAVGAPVGTFTLLQGWSHELGLALVRDPRIRAVGFTGSLRGGRALFDAAMTRPDPIPVYAEMGSVNPVFLLPSALGDGAARVVQGLAQSVTLGVGQFCTNPGVVVAGRGDALDRFVAALAERVGAEPAATMLYAGLGGAYAEGLARACASGAALVAGSREAGAQAALVRPALLRTDADRFVAARELREELFGPASLVVEAGDEEELLQVADALEGQLTATIHGTADELRAHARLVRRLQEKVGRLVFNGFPTGVEVSHAMQHGGPYPASTDSRTTSVGTAAIARFARPVCFQGFPDDALPPALRDRNERAIWRLVDGELTRAHL